MSDATTTAQNAREALARALNALQSDPNVPAGLMELAAPVAQAMGALHQIERTGQLAPHADVALNHVRTALGSLQQQPATHPAVAQAMEAVASSLGLVHNLSRLAQAPAPQAPTAPQAPSPPRPTGPLSVPRPGGPMSVPRPASPIAAGAAVPPPPGFVQQAVVPAPPAFVQQAVAPAPPAFVQQAVAPAPPAFVAPPPPPPPPVYAQPEPPPPPPPVYQPPPPVYQPPPPPPQAAYAATVPQPATPAAPPPPPPQAVQAPPAFQAPPAYQASPQFQQVAVDPFARPAPLPSGGNSHAPGAPTAGTELPLFAADLGTHSTTNFYKGLSGNDIIDHGGLFVSTYMVPKIGTPVRLHIALPGGYEFEANAIVAWSREQSDAGNDAPPGFGAKITAITAEARQLVYRYVRNREPLFHDDL